MTEAIEKNTSLTSLDFGPYNFVNIDLFNTILSKNKLKKVRIKSTPELIFLLFSSNSIEDLTLYDKLGHVNFKCDLFQVIESNTTLKKLTILHSITEEFALKMLKSIARNNTLQYIKINIKYLPHHRTSSSSSSSSSSSTKSASSLCLYI
jgi:hypothetical protein